MGKVNKSQDKKVRTVIARGVGCLASSYEYQPSKYGMGGNLDKSNDKIGHNVSKSSQKLDPFEVISAQGRCTTRINQLCY